MRRPEHENSLVFSGEMMYTLVSRTESWPPSSHKGYPLNLRLPYRIFPVYSWFLNRPDTEYLN